MRRILIAIGLVLATIAGAALLRFHRPLPRVTGEMIVDGATAPIEILRDRYGIPHVRAANRLDAIFGLGFVHAQDRLWQMEVQRRAAKGRLSEALGPAALPTDRFMRTIGFARAAASARATLDASSLETIDAYVRGVNAFLAGTTGWRLPIEYSLTGITPEPWTAEDVVSTMKLVAWVQGMNWREELLRLRVGARVGPQRALDLIPDQFTGTSVLPSASPAMSASLEQLSAVLDQLAPGPANQAASALDQSGAGSNAWVLAGSRTASGRPILANDPHIGAQAPSVWYLVHLTGGALDVIGATFPGTCAVAIGHNANVAWGITNAMADAQDLFTVGYQEPTVDREEMIRIKGGAEERLTVRVSANGPIVSGVIGERGALALRWTGLDPGDATISAFVALNSAANTTELRAALARIHAPLLGIVYAGADGEIGYAASGAVPVRDAASRAWTSQFHAETVAASTDPSSGFIVTANNAIGGAAPPLSTSYDPPYRAQRITAMIEAETALSIDDVARMQQDVVSVQPAAIAAFLFDRVEPRDARGAEVLGALRKWDGNLRPGSAEAAIFKRYYDEAARAIFRDELGDALWADYRAAPAALARAFDRIAQKGSAQWCDDVDLPGEQSCGAVLGDALTRAIDALEQQQGATWRAWRWDANNVVRFPHAPLDAVAWLRPIFSRELQRPGDGFTVNPAMRIREQTLVASYRQVIDVGDWDKSVFVMPMGQSGHPMSAHYDDLLTLWNEGRYAPMTFSEPAVRAAAWSTLILRPRLRPRQALSSSADTPREK